MSTTNLRQTVLDLPVWDQLDSPTTSTLPLAGSTLCADLRGTGRYQYCLLTLSMALRYDTYTNTWQAIPPPTYGNGLGTGGFSFFDPTNNRWWVAVSDGVTAPTFGYCDLTTWAWTTRSMSGFPGTFGVDASVVHTDNLYNGAGNNDYAYVVGNNSTSIYRYSVSGNSWTTLAVTLSTAVGAGGSIHWLPSWDADKLVIFCGGGTSTVLVYSISAGTASTLTQKFPVTYNVGTNACALWGSSQILTVKDGLQRFYKLDLTTGVTNAVATLNSIPPSLLITSQNRMLYQKDSVGNAYFYYLASGQTYFMRSPL